MDKLLSKLRQAVANKQSGGPAIHDVRTASLTFNTYRWVLFVVAIVAFYYAFIVTDRYVTEARVYVKSADTGAAIMPQLQLLGAQGSGQDSMLINAYLQSRDLMERIEKDTGFTQHFAESGADWFSRLSRNASSESKLDYFKSRLSTSSQPDSGMIIIRGQGFTPEYSLEFVQATIKAGEEFINNVGQQIAKEEIFFVEKEVERARNNLKDVRDRLLAFQNENGLLSAEAAGVSMQKLVSEMEADLVRLRTEEKVLSSYLNEEATELVTIRSRRSALEEQLLLERERMASQDGVSINDVHAAYQELEMELKFATDLYKTTLVGLERARVESYHKLKHLVVVQAPSLPEKAKYPRKLYDLATLFVALTLVYGIITMILATIREHRDV